MRKYVFPSYAVKIFIPNPYLAVSGEAPAQPVASTKSGTVFEKRLIEAYIAEHGKDPVTGEEITTADLIELKCTLLCLPSSKELKANPQPPFPASTTVRPRPPTLTSIPALLATFQNEWDALALETHTLRQQLVQVRQELSTALYQHDAATRVIARLLKERDEAREALSNVTVGAGASSAGMDVEQMDVDNAAEIPAAMQEKIDETKKEYVLPGRGRPIKLCCTDRKTGYPRDESDARYRRIGQPPTQCLPSPPS